MFLGVELSDESFSGRLNDLTSAVHSRLAVQAESSVRGGHLMVTIRTLMCYRDADSLRTVRSEWVV